MSRRSVRLHRLFPLALVLTLLFAPRPAQAQAGAAGWTLDFSGFEVLLVGGTAVAGIYVVGGSLAFATLDVVYLARNKPFPRALRWLQLGYGLSFFGIAAIAAEAQAPAEVVAPFLVGGAVFTTVPVLEWGGRDQSRRAPTQLSLGPMGVRLAGSF